MAVGGCHGSTYIWQSQPDFSYTEPFVKKQPKPAVPRTVRLTRWVVFGVWSLVLKKAPPLPALLLTKRSNLFLFLVRTTHDYANVMLAAVIVPGAKMPRHPMEHAK